MRLRTLQSNAGFTYIAALVMVVIVGVMSAKAAVVWKTRMQREKEEELLFRGDQIRTAMQRWYKFKPPKPGAPAPPPTTQAPVPLMELKSLAQDPGTAGKVRYTRPSNLVDPITGKDWDVIKGDGGKIIGVKSTSEHEPIKQGNFPDDYIDFEGKKKYSEWEFIYNRVPQPGVKAGKQTGLGGSATPVGTSAPVTPSTRTGSNQE